MQNTSYSNTFIAHIGNALFTKKHFRTIQLLISGMLLLISVGLQQAIAGDKLTFYEISEGNGGLDSILSPSDLFGNSIALLNDFDGDGNNELAVGAPYYDDLVENEGAIFILYMNNDGKVKNSKKVTFAEHLDTTGYAVKNMRAGTVTSVGDLDGNGICDIAVGAPGAYGYSQENAWQIRCGRLYIFFLDSTATVINYTAMSSINYYDKNAILRNVGSYAQFGFALASLGDVNHDGITDIVATTPAASETPKDSIGGFITLQMDNDGSILSSSFVSGLTDEEHFNYFSGMQLGHEIANIGDIDGNGVDDLAVQSLSDTTTDIFDGTDKYEIANGSKYGAVYIVFMERYGEVLSTKKISMSRNSLNGSLAEKDLFGDGIASVGDLNGDSIPDIIVSCSQRIERNLMYSGVFYILFLNRDGTVRNHIEFNRSEYEFLNKTNAFLGSHIANIGDINHDGFPDFAVSARFGENEGGFYVMTYKAYTIQGTLLAGDSPATNSIIQLRDATSGLTTEELTIGADGKFEFISVPEGRYKIHVELPAYLSDEYIDKTYSFTLDVNTHIYNLNLPLLKETSAEDDSYHNTQIFPNPAKEKLHISFKTSMPNEVKIYNLDGRVLNEIKPQAQTLIINIEGYPSGYYTYEALYSNGSVEKGGFVVE